MNPAQAFAVSLLESSLSAQAAGVASKTSEVVTSPSDMPLTRRRYSPVSFDQP